MSVLGNDLNDVVASEVLIKDILEWSKWLEEMNSESLDHVLTSEDLYDIMVEDMGNEISRRIDKCVIKQMNEKGYIKSLFDISKRTNQF